MDTVGFILMLIGIGSLDSEGNWWYLAAAMTLVGLAMIKGGTKNGKNGR